MKPLVIKTERTDVLLRQYEIEDAPAIFDVIDRSREHLSKWGDPTARKYPSLDDVVQSIKNPITSGRLRMGIWLGKQFTGGINMQPLPEPYFAEIGYWLGKDFTGRGLMSMSVRAMVGHAFDSYYYLTAYTRIENTDSQRVLERVGFRKLHQIGAHGSSYYNYRLSAHEWNT